MRFINVLIIFFSFFYPLSVSAEYYRYTDKSGIVHFTDNLTNVPVEQRIKANTYKEIRDSINIEKNLTEDSDTKKKVTKDQIPESKQNNKTSESEALLQNQRLNKEKQILDKEYEQLIIKKQALKKEKTFPSNSIELKIYQNKVNQLNQQISDFEKRRKEFEKKVKVFNAKSIQ